MTGHVASTIAFALGGALLYALSNVLEQGEAERVADEHSLRPSLLVNLARRRRWLVGLGTDAGGFALSAAAISLGAIAFVQPLMAMGLLLTLLLGRIINGRAIRKRDWLAAVVLCAGLAVFLYEVSPTGGHDIVQKDRWLIAGPAIVGAVALCIACARGTHGARRAALLGVAAGISFAASVMLTKTFVHYLGEGPLAWIDHWEPYGMAVSIIGGFLLAESAFQAGSLAAAVGALEATEPIVAVIFGVGLLDESLMVTTTAQVFVIAASTVAVLWAIMALARAESAAVEPQLTLRES